MFEPPLGLTCAKAVHRERNMLKARGYKFDVAYITPPILLGG
jgi:hypothetical protein